MNKSKKVIEFKPTKLHLGSSTKKFPDFIHIDLDKSVEPDIIDNIFTLQSVKDESADLIYASHCIEHASYKEIGPAFIRWHDILRDGGVLRLSVPDMDAIFAHYFYWKDLNLLKHMIWGDQSDSLNFHKNGWDFGTLKQELEFAGFRNIRLWEPWNTEPHCYIDDYSHAHYPDFHKKVKLRSGKLVDFGGKLMSLNVEGTK